MLADERLDRSLDIAIITCKGLVPEPSSSLCSQRVIEVCAGWIRPKRSGAYGVDAVTVLELLRGEWIEGRDMCKPYGLFRPTVDMGVPRVEGNVLERSGHNDAEAAMGRVEQVFECVKAAEGCVLRRCS